MSDIFSFDTPHCRPPVSTSGIQKRHVKITLVPYFEPSDFLQAIRDAESDREVVRLMESFVIYSGHFKPEQCYELCDTLKERRLKPSDYHG